MNASMPPACRNIPENHYSVSRAVNCHGTRHHRRLRGPHLVRRPAPALALALALALAQVLVLVPVPVDRCLVQWPTSTSGRRRRPQARAEGH
jgi:hypothetical protein